MCGLMKSRSQITILKENLLFSDAVIKNISYIKQPNKNLSMLIFGALFLLNTKQVFN